MYLTNAEEQVMKLLWKLEKAFIRDLMNEFPILNLLRQPSLPY